MTPPDGMNDELRLKHSLGRAVGWSIGAALYGGYAFWLGSAHSREIAVGGALFALGWWLMHWRERRRARRTNTTTPEWPTAPRE